MWPAPGCDAAWPVARTPHGPSPARRAARTAGGCTCTVTLRAQRATPAAGTSMARTHRRCPHPATHAGCGGGRQRAARAPLGAPRSDGRDGAARCAARAAAAAGQRARLLPASTSAARPPPTGVRVARSRIVVWAT
eukprot:4461749-Prymnesium_polylepis.1